MVKKNFPINKNIFLNLYNNIYIMLITYFYKKLDFYKKVVIIKKIIFNFTKWKTQIYLQL